MGWQLRRPRGSAVAALMRGGMVCPGWFAKRETASLKDVAT